MHIPDGYIAPAMTLGAGVLTVPIWGIAARRVQNVLSNRTVPLLAIFAALSFTIMMFNIPVPGGTQPRMGSAARLSPSSWGHGRRLLRLASP